MPLWSGIGSREWSWRGSCLTSHSRGSGSKEIQALLALEPNFNFRTWIFRWKYRLKTRNTSVLFEPCQGGWRVHAWTLGYINIASDPFRWFAWSLNFIIEVRYTLSAFQRDRAKLLSSFRIFLSLEFSHFSCCLCLWLTTDQSRVPTSAKFYRTSWMQGESAPTWTLTWLVWTYKVQ